MADSKFENKKRKRFLFNYGFYFSLHNINVQLCHVYMLSAEL